MPTLLEQLKIEIERVREIPDPKNITKKAILKAEMAIKSKNQDRMELYLTALQGVADSSGEKDGAEDDMVDSEAKAQIDHDEATRDL